MAENRQGGDPHQGPRAIPEERWEESANAERKLDALVEEGIPPRQTGTRLLEAADDADYTPEMRQALRDQDERIEDQARVGPRKFSDPEQP